MSRVKDEIPPSFFREVGGVAFSAVAQGRNGLAVSNLSYDASLPDGKRLRVTLQASDGESRTVSADLYDWELVPIARYADSPFHACFTLFGTPEDEAQRRRAKRIMGYHPVLEDTLVGLRLMQADLLILTEEAADLPKEGGEYILGKGESYPETRLNETRFRQVEEWRRAQSEDWASYVISDIGQEVEFYERDGRLVVVGDPIWYTWKNPPEYEQVVQEEMRRLSINQIELALGMVDEQKAESLHDNIKRKTRDMPIVPLERHSRELTRQIQRADGVNPTVFATLSKTMRYSALFRHAKQTMGSPILSRLSSGPRGIHPRILWALGLNKDSFKYFLWSLRGVSYDPEQPPGPVETPNLIT